MKVRIIYRYESDHAREVLDYLRDFARQTGHVIDEVNPDTPEGADICRLYDVVEYPTVIAVRDSGELLHMWRGRPLPTISEVSFYV